MNSKITGSEWTFLILFALMVDALQALTAIFVITAWMGTLINILMAGLFPVLFILKGMPFWNRKRTTTYVGTIFIEMFPFLNSLPTWTLQVVLLYINYKSEQIIKKPKTPNEAGFSIRNTSEKTISQ